MKKIAQYFTISFLSLLMLSVHSCGDSEDEISTARLTGNWIATSLDVSNCNDASRNRNETLSCDEAECYSLLLNEDGSYVFIERQNGVFQEAGNWSVSGETIQFVYSEEDETFSYSRSYSVSNDNLLLTEVVEGTGCEETTTYARGIDDFL